MNKFSIFTLALSSLCLILPTSPLAAKRGGGGHHHGKNHHHHYHHHHHDDHHHGRNRRGRGWGGGGWGGGDGYYGDAGIVYYGQPYYSYPNYQPVPYSGYYSEVETDQPNENGPISYNHFSPGYVAGNSENYYNHPTNQIPHNSRGVFLGE